MSSLAIGVLAAVAVVAIVVILMRSREKTIEVPSQPIRPVSAPTPAAAVAAPAPSAPEAEVNPAEFAAFAAWLKSDPLPALRLEADPGTPITAGGTRIGGPVWLADGEAWPTDSSGAPLEFVAQVDFAAMPALPDFPTNGVLQFFVGNGENFGTDLDDPIRSRAKVVWRPQIAGGALRPPPEMPADSPFGDAESRAAGQPLAATPFDDTRDENDREVIERLSTLGDAAQSAPMDDILDSHTDGRGFCHQVGGYPTFSNEDFRKPGHYDDYNRLLLRITSDDEEMLTWHDGFGEALFLITSADLAKRDFSRAIFRWDSW